MVTILSYAYTWLVSWACSWLRALSALIALVFTMNAWLWWPYHRSYSETKQTQVRSFSFRWASIFYRLAWSDPFPLSFLLLSSSQRPFLVWSSWFLSACWDLSHWTCKSAWPYDLTLCTNEADRALPKFRPFFKFLRSRGSFLMKTPVCFRLRIRIDIFWVEVRLWVARWVL